MSKILVVEDDETLSMGIEFALKKEGFDVSVGHSVKEANKLFMEKDFDLFLLDVMLPDGNGYELCKSIREISNIPIIFLTACDEEVNVVLGLDIGADDYITKPFRVRELISRIKASLRRAGDKEAVNDYMKSNEVMVYPLETKVKVKDKDINLTHSEYRLLITFMNNPQQTLTRDTILQKLWDVEGEFVDDNTLSVYIRRLREKLEENPSDPRYIITVRGLGYKWNQLVSR